MSRATPRSRCPACDYALLERPVATDAVCPECGTALVGPAAEHVRERRVLRSLARWAVAVAIVCGVGCGAAAWYLPDRGGLLVIPGVIFVVAASAPAVGALFLSRRLG